jgi:hypothetical protein
MDPDEIEVVAMALAEKDDPGTWDLPEQFGQMEFRQHYRELAKVAIAALHREKAQRRQQAVRLLTPDGDRRPARRDGN